MTERTPVREAGEEIEQLLEAVRSMVSPPAWQRVDELMRAVLDLYGAGLQQVVALLPDDRAGDALRRRLLGDPLLASLLLLHGLHPDSLAERLQQALTRVRPYLGSHGGDVELVGSEARDDGIVVRLRMTGSCDGCPSSVLTVKLAVEGAIRELAPEVVRIEVDGLDRGEATAAPAPDASPDGHATWVDIEPLNGAGVAATDVNGAPIVLCRVDAQLYAYRNVCPSCASTLDAGELDGDRLECPACGQRYDVRRAGRAIDDAALHLDPLPLLEESGQVAVAVPSP